MGDFLAKFPIKTYLIQSSTDLHDGSWAISNPDENANTDVTMLRIFVKPTPYTTESESPSH